MENEALWIWGCGHLMASWRSWPGAVVRIGSFCQFQNLYRVFIIKNRLCEKFKYFCWILEAARPYMLWPNNGRGDMSVCGCQNMVFWAVWKLSSMKYNEKHILCNPHVIPLRIEGSTPIYNLAETVSRHCLGCVFLSLIPAPLVQNVLWVSLSIWDNGHCPATSRCGDIPIYVWPAWPSVPNSWLGSQLNILLAECGFLDSQDL